MILLALGAGLGLSSISPWSNRGLTASAIGAAAIGWLIFIEIVSSALGGYLTARLRTKWALIHDDEVYFRDTANGFLAWAVALIVTVTFLASAAATMVGGAGERSSPQAGSSIDPNAYFVDALFRSEHTVSQDIDSCPWRIHRSCCDGSLVQPLAMLLPPVGAEEDLCRTGRTRLWCPSFQSGMRPMTVIVMLEIDEFCLQIW